MTSNLPACFYRGGTSNGLLIHRAHLPAKVSDWRAVLARAMGSPDPYGRQLNGMGGGVSSLSKVCVVEKSNCEEADVDYTFVQVGIKDGSLDMAGNCGNMSSAVGPFALDEGLLSLTPRGTSLVRDEDGSPCVTVRLRNTNTSKIIHSKFPVFENGGRLHFLANGNYAIDGVSGTSSLVSLSFLSPAGAKTGNLYPSGNPTDTLSLPDGSTVLASLVDISNPGVFIRFRDLQGREAGKLDDSLSHINTADIEGRKDLMKRLEDIRRAGAMAMGMDPNVSSIPKIVMIGTPDDGEEFDITCVALSMEQVHKAVPLTLALNLGVCCHLENTLPWMMRRGPSPDRIDRGQSTIIGHPSGRLEVKAMIDGNTVHSAVLLRTARLLMKGAVNCDQDDRSSQSRL